MGTGVRVLGMGELEEEVAPKSHRGYSEPTTSGSSSLKLVLSTASGYKSPGWGETHTYME